jgi:hypothetical protein
MKFFRDRGFIVTRVEQRIHMPKAPYPVTRDAYGFGDLLVAHAKLRIIALVQCTGGMGGNLANRISKILDTPEINEDAYRWISAGGRIFAHGWAKRGPRGKAKHWTCDAREIVFSDTQGNRLAEIDGAEYELDPMRKRRL